MTTKAAQMYSLVEGWHKSQQSKSDYCRSIPINIHTFTYWVQKYKHRKVSSVTPKFIPMTVEKIPTTVSPSIELSYPNGVRLCINGRSDMQLLESLIKIDI